MEPPEEEDVCLFGYVRGHPRHVDGKEVLTTAVRYTGIDGIVTKSGSEYQLGAVDPAYDALYPGAFQRLLKVLESAPAVPPNLSGGGSGQFWNSLGHCASHC